MSRSMSDRMLPVFRKLSDEVDTLLFPSPVHTVYNPLSYARSTLEQYCRRFGEGEGRTVFLGLNPGPFGMAQTGIPFGTIKVVRDWLGLDGSAIGKPIAEHPKRPVLGFDCARDEVSGRRLWGLFQETFSTPELCFSRIFVLNWCPLVFMDDGGRNLTPDKFRGSAASSLEAACNQALADLLAILKPRSVVGVGGFATARLAQVAPNLPRCQLPHPSPANPAANKGWNDIAIKALLQAGLWPLPSPEQA